MFLQGLERITGAARRESTMLSEIWAECIAIQFDECNQQFLHFEISLRQWFSKDAYSCRLFHRPASARHITTISTAGNSRRWTRKLSLAKRLIRFLSTALLADFFEIASPNRGKSRLFERNRTVRALSMDLSALSNTRRY